MTTPKTWRLRRKNHHYSHFFVGFDKRDGFHDLDRAHPPALNLKRHDHRKIILAADAAHDLKALPAERRLAGFVQIPELLGGELLEMAKISPAASNSAAL